jgi:ABC 3 transport family
MELCFLVVMALATSMTVPVVGALLMFALMTGPAAAARSFTRRPGHAIAVATGIPLVTVWVGIALSYRTNWPLGFSPASSLPGSSCSARGGPPSVGADLRHARCPCSALPRDPERERGAPAGPPAARPGERP